MISRARSEEIKTKLISLWGTVSPKEISTSIGVTLSTVHNYARKLKLPHLTYAQSRSVFNKAVNYRFFETWSPKMAYVLGYTWADGNVRVCRGLADVLNYRCAEPDTCILYKIRDLLSSTHKIVHKPGGMDKRGVRFKPFAYLQVCSQLLAKSLIDLHGLLPRKSELDLSMSYVPEELRNHFARGFFDGDGCVGVTSKGYPYFTYYGTQRFVGDICDISVRGAKISYKIPKIFPSVRRRGPCYAARWSRGEDIRNLYSWLYKDNEGMFLERKRGRFKIAVAASV